MIDSIMFIIFTTFIFSLLAICGLYIILIIAIKIDDYFFDKKWEKIYKEEKSIMGHIKENLAKFAEEHNIPITYDTEHFGPDTKHNDSAGYISYTIISKYNCIDEYKNFEIFIRADKSMQWSTLAHELGHYISISIYHDDSEYGANFEAYKLIKSWFSDRELKHIDDILEICFDMKKSEKFYSC